MDKAAHVLETAVDRGKADISDLVQRLDALHDHLTDVVGGHFPLQGIVFGERGNLYFEKDAEGHTMAIISIG